MAPAHDPSSSGPAQPGPDLSGLPPVLADAVAALMAADRVLATLEPQELDGRQAATVAQVLATSASVRGAVSARLLTVIEADGLWATGGARSFTTWVARQHGLAAHTAARQVQLARRLRDDLPTTTAATLAGEVTLEQAQVLATYAPTTDARRAALSDPEFPCNEAFLVEQARQLSVDAFRMLVRRWAAAADPDADDRGYVQAADREYLELSRALDGYHLAGQLTIENGQALLAALKAVDPVPAAGDERSTSQRRGNALGAVARVVLDHGLAGAARAVRPHLNVVVDYPTLQWLAARAETSDAAPLAPDADEKRTNGSIRVPSGPSGAPADAGAGATPVAYTAPTAPAVTPAMIAGDGPAVGPQFEDGTPIPRGLLERIACDSDLTRIVFGPQSQVLDVGRAERTFTGPRRTALVARDRHCRYPGCTAPPGLSEGHHIRHWVRDHGDTSVRNGILLCWYHHDLVHRRRIEIHRHDDQWVFTDRLGRPIRDDTAVPDDGFTAGSDMRDDDAGAGDAAIGGDDATRHHPLEGTGDAA